MGSFKQTLAPIAWLIIILLCVLVSQCDAWEYEPPGQPLEYEDTMEIDLEEKGTLHLSFYRGYLQSVEQVGRVRGGSFSVLYAPNKSTLTINGGVVRETSKCLP